MPRYAIPLGEYMRARLEPLGFRYTKRTKQWVIDDPSDEVLLRVEKLHPQRLFQTDATAKRESTPGTLWIDKAHNNGFKLTLEAAGARWDKKFGAWYIDAPSREQVSFLLRHGLTTVSPDLYPNRVASPKVAVMLSNAQSISGSGERVYLNVPYSDKDFVKSFGCFWDRAVRKWFSLLDNPHLPYLKSQYEDRQKKAA